MTETFDQMAARLWMELATDTIRHADLVTAFAHALKAEIEAPLVLDLSAAYERLERREAELAAAQERIKEYQDACHQKQEILNWLKAELADRREAVTITTKPAVPTQSSPPTPA